MRPAQLVPGGGDRRSRSPAPGRKTHHRRHLNPLRGPHNAMYSARRTAGLCLWRSWLHKQKQLFADNGRHRVHAWAAVSAHTLSGAKRRGCLGACRGKPPGREDEPGQIPQIRELVARILSKLSEILEALLVSYFQLHVV